MPQGAVRLQADYWRLQAKRAQAQADLMRDPIARTQCSKLSRSTKQWPTTGAAEVIDTPTNCPES